MNLGKAQAGVLLSIPLLEEYIRALRRIELIPATVTFQVNVFGANVDAILAVDPPEYRLVADGGTTKARLHLTGPITIAGTQVLQLDTWVLLTPILKPDSDPLNAPGLGFQYDGVVVSPSPPITDQMIDDVFQNPPVSTVLKGINIPVLGPLIDNIGPVLFRQTPPPAAGLWPAALKLMLSTGTDPDSVGVFVAVPSEDPTPTDDQTLFPLLTEYGLVFSRAFMDTALDAQGKAGEGNQGGGIKVTKLKISMGDNDIRIDGKAKKDSATITFKGPVTFQLIRGSTQFAVDASGINVDVNLPWWMDVLQFLLGSPFVSIPTFGIIRVLGDLVLATQGTSLNAIEAEIAGVPSLVQGTVAKSMASGLNILAMGLNDISGVGEIKAASTPDQSRVIKGHVAVFAQVFINKLTERIVDGTWSTKNQRISYLKLQRGRWFDASELAKIAGMELIETPGYHPVKPYVRHNTHTGTPEYVRGHMRDDPDLSKQDNLLERFGPGT